MHIKIRIKVNNKKQGYVLLESIVILMIVACVCMILNKISINNYLKSSVIYTREDIKTLSQVEEEALLEAMKYFNNDKTKTEYIIGNPSVDIRKITINININNDSGLLLKEKGNNGKNYIELDCKRNSEEGIETINLVPKLYKTDYIIF